MKKVYNLSFQIISVGLISAYYHAYNIAHHLPWFMVGNDIVHFYNLILDPGILYIDKLIEYPVLTGLFIQFVDFINENSNFYYFQYVKYYFFNSVFIIIFAILTTLILSSVKQKRKNIIMYWIFAPSMFFFLVYNWDILTLFFVISSFYFTKRNKNILASIFLALGFCGKFYPIIYLIPLLFKNNILRNKFKIFVAFIMTVFIVNIPIMILNFQGWLYFFKFNNIRDPNPDSIWGIIYFIFPSINILDINLLSLFLFFIVYISIIWKFKNIDYIKLCFFVTLAFLLFNKVFSPQYLLWLLPFFVVCYPINKKIFYGLELSNLIVLFTVYSYFTILPQNINYLYLCMIFVVIRHIVLLYIFIETTGLGLDKTEQTYKESNYLYKLKEE